MMSFLLLLLKLTNIKSISFSEWLWGKVLESKHYRQEMKIDGQQINGEKVLNSLNPQLRNK